jgi:hypothetical protein
MAKMVMIIGSTVVAGAVCYEHECPLKVTDAVAVRLQGAGVLLGDPIDAEDEIGALDEPWTKEEAEQIADLDADGVPDGFEDETVIDA